MASFRKKKYGRKSSHTKKELKSRQKIMKYAVLVIVISTFALFAVKYNEAQKEIARLQDPETVAADEVSQLATKVGQLIKLPQDEVPTVATVVDADKLRDQPFFADAQDGDRVLMYAEASKAILYRPSENKIIEVAPINIGDDSSTGTTEAQSSESTSDTDSSETQ